jgi:hypothetical protein
MYYGGCVPRKEYPTLTEAEFLVHAKWMRTDLSVKSTKGAYLVLVEGLTQKVAAEQTGASPANVNDSVRRVTQRHNEFMEAYGPRLKEKATDHVKGILDLIAADHSTAQEEQNAAS